MEGRGLGGAGSRAGTVDTGHVTLTGQTALVERQPEWWQVVSLGDHRLTDH